MFRSETSEQLLKSLESTILSVSQTTLAHRNSKTDFESNLEKAKQAIKSAPKQSGSQQGFLDDEGMEVEAAGDWEGDGGHAGGGRRQGKRLVLAKSRYFG